MADKFPVNETTIDLSHSEARSEYARGVPFSCEEDYDQDHGQGEKLPPKSTQQTQVTSTSPPTFIADPLYNDISSTVSSNDEVSLPTEPARQSSQNSDEYVDANAHLNPVLKIIKTKVWEYNCPGKEKFEVQEEGSYSIETAGGRGGDLKKSNSNMHGGIPQVVIATFLLHAGEILEIFVGGNGSDGGGGGGASAVCIQGHKEPLQCASGGGGAGLHSHGLDGQGSRHWLLEWLSKYIKRFGPGPGNWGKGDNPGAPGAGWIGEAEEKEDHKFAPGISREKGWCGGIGCNDGHGGFGGGGAAGRVAGGGGGGGYRGGDGGGYISYKREPIYSGGTGGTSFSKGSDIKFSENRSGQAYVKLVTTD